MSEGLSTTTTTPQSKLVPEGYSSWNDYWTKVHNQPWRTEPEIDEERQKELARRREAIQPDIENGIYPFKDIEPKLTRADVEWLLATHRSGGMEGPVDWSEKGPRRIGLNVQGADLRSVDLRNLPLTCMNGGFLANQSSMMTPEQRDAAGVHMEGANLFQSHLEGANLSWGHLEGANLASAHVEEGNLTWGHLEGANLSTAHLAGANIRAAYFSSVSYLDGITMTSKQHGSIKLAGVRWGGADLTVVDWTQLAQLGDEREIGTPMPAISHRARNAERLRRTERAVRANRQLATALRGQGLNETADRFAYRAQVLQRQVLRRRRNIGGYLFSLLLAALAGYGYRLGRIIVAYALIVVVFAAAFLVSDALSGQTPLTVQHAFDALQISLNAVHGRVFFAQFHLDTLQSWLATAESIIGIVIEGVFVAMLIQRFFGR